MFVHMGAAPRVPFSARFGGSRVFSGTLGERRFLRRQRGQPGHVGPGEVQIAGVRRGHGQRLRHV